jgi:hypothetical protein
VGELWEDWLDLVGKVMAVSLTEHRDCFLWTANKTFSAKNLYNDIILRVGARANCWAWKAKLPLKIKIFLWFLKNGVVLTKDNLVKRRWKGCGFCAQQEIVQHLFFDCPMARLVWGCVVVAFGINKPTSVQHLFGPWLRSFSKKQRNLVVIGVAALCWAIWISRNDLVFNKSQYVSTLQVVFRGVFWIRSWAILSKDDGRNSLKAGGLLLESVALAFFHGSGWNTLKRIVN